MNPAPPNWYYVYFLQSEKDGSTYIGCTSNLHNRLKEHRKGKSYTTKKMLPFKLIYFEAYKSRPSMMGVDKSKEDAFRREKHLKYYSSALRNLKIRLKDTLNIVSVQKTVKEKGGAG